MSLESLYGAGASRSLRVAVLGAGGTIAPAIVRDLASSEDEVESIACLDISRERAAAVASAHGLGRATAAAVDARDPQALQFAFDECDIVVNAASYRLNETVMDGCEAAGCAYVDLGGLYHVTASQLRRDPAWRAEGRLAVLGCGAGPGKTNVMAALAASRLDSVSSVRCASAGHDAAPPDGFSTPYALETLLDEVTEDAQVVRDGSVVAVAPLTDAGRVPFPAPIGERDTIYTLHSEALTLPSSLGAASCDFRLALAPAVLEGLRARAGSDAPVAVQERPAPPSSQTYSAQHVSVVGTRAGEPVEVVVTALTVPHAEWGIGGGILSTGSVAAAVVRLYARGALPPAGVLPPEVALPPDALLAELEPRGCTVTVTERSLST